MPGSRIIAVKTILLAGALVLLAAGSGRVVADEDNSEIPLSYAEVEAIVDVACTQCHGLRPVKVLRDGPSGWKGIVQDMVIRGAQLKSHEVNAVVEYLAQEYGPGAGVMQTGTLPPGAVVSDSDAGMSSADIVLPEGEGMEAVQGLCQVCHDLGRVVTVRRTRKDWRLITKDMVGRGLAASPGEIDQMVEYLVTHFGRED